MIENILIFQQDSQQIQSECVQSSISYSFHNSDQINAPRIQNQSQIKMTQDKIIDLNDDNLIIFNDESQSIVITNRDQNKKNQIKVIENPQIIHKKKQKKSMKQTTGNFIIERILFFPQKFYLYLGKTHSLTARRKIMQTNSLYYFFSSLTELSTKDNSFMGSMQANFNGTEYNVYDKNKINIAYITFTMKKNSPNQISVFIVDQIDQMKPKLIKNILLSKDRAQQQNILQIYNKKPKLDKHTKVFLLDFNGLAKKSSKKNCVLQFEQRNSLILAKQQQKVYNIEFRYPFTNLIAFAFSIAQYQQKLGNLVD